MGNSLVDLFKEETTFNVKASEMFGLMREAVKAEFLLNALECDVPHKYARQISTGEKEEQTEKNTPPPAGQDVRSGFGSVGVIRKCEQRVEWIDIQNIIRKGRAPVSLPPGTEINFTLKNGAPASVVVVAVDHYEKGDCVFWFRRVVGRHYMNDSNTNKGGFRDSDMRDYLNKVVFDMLPDELQSIIAPHNTVQKIGDETIVSKSDALFLMSVYEGLGANKWAEYNGTDKQFPYFKDHVNRIAYDDDEDPAWYWTADPSVDETMYFCVIDSKGYSDDSNAYNESGVAPLFVIK